MTPIVQRMGLLQKSAATTRQMMPTVIKCPSHARGLRQHPLYPYLVCLWSALLRQPGGFEGSDCAPVSKRNASALDQPTVRQVFRKRRGRITSLATI
jgi:hypothetical protein